MATEQTSAHTQASPQRRSTSVSAERSTPPSRLAPANRRGSTPTCCPGSAAPRSTSQPGADSTHGRTAASNNTNAPTAMTNARTPGSMALITLRSTCSSSARNAATSCGSSFRREPLSDR